MACELAEVSLWLNCLHRSGHVPWFGYQLVCGDSLVGARRQVYPRTALGKDNRKADLWFNRAPDRVPPPGEGDAPMPGAGAARGAGASSVVPAAGAKAGDAPPPAPATVKRPAGTVYHFLLPDPGMADCQDKAARALEPDAYAQIRTWRKRFFTKGMRKMGLRVVRKDLRRRSGINRVLTGSGGIHASP